MELFENMIMGQEGFKFDYATSTISIITVTIITTLLITTITMDITITIILLPSTQLRGYLPNYWINFPSASHSRPTPRGPSPR